jgi:hypothetical protein
MSLTRSVYSEQSHVMCTGGDSGICAPKEQCLHAGQVPLQGRVGTQWSLGSAHRRIWRPEERTLLRTTLLTMRSLLGALPTCSVVCLLGDCMQQCMSTVQVSFGVHKTEEEAARQYDRALIIVKGRLAKTNFPVSDYDTEIQEYEQLLWQR